MQNSPRFWRSLFFILLVTALCGGLALPVVSSPARAAPQMQASMQVIINEIAWAGTAASASDEWIELYNPGATDIDLTGWILRSTDNTPNIALSGAIPAGGYYLLERSGDTTVSNVPMNLSYAGGLNNTAETLELRDNNNLLIDTANQGGANWYAGNATGFYSMERISVLPDGPTAWATNNGAVRNGLDAATPTPNPINGTPKQPNSVTLALTATVTSTITNTATATGTPTNTGTATNTATATSTGAPTNTATATATSSPSSTVLINEVAWAGTLASSDDEWIELYNPSSTVTVDLTGWVLKSTDNTPNISLTGSLAPNAFLVLAKNGGTFQAPVPSTTNNTITLSNSGEILSLVDASGRTIDTANSDGGSWPAGLASPTYASMERVGTVNQWITYAGTSPVAYDRNNNPVKGTPGRSNWITTTTFTTITADSPDPSVINQNVTVTVTVIGGPTPPSGTVSITGANTNCSITLSNGTGSCVVKFTSAGAKTIIATYPDPSHPSSDTESHSVTTTAVARTPTRVPTPLPPPPLIGINEFVPRPGHDWNLDGVINVSDEYIELINHGVIDVNLNGYSLDDEVNIGSAPFRLPSVTLKPGERKVFYGSETGLLLSDGGDGVRLLKPNGQLGDAYNYFVVRFPDQSYCRLPDNGGLDDWNRNCFPTPGLQNSLSASSVNPPAAGDAENLCPIADTLPPDFVYAECLPFGNNIWNSAYWDRFGWFGEKSLPESPGKWSVYVD